MMKNLNLLVKNIVRRVLVLVLLAMTVLSPTPAMAATQAAAILTHKSEREIYRLIEANEIHFIETDRAFVCLNLLPGPQVIEGELK